LHCSRIFVKCLVEKHNLVLVFLQIIKGFKRKILYLFGRIFVKCLVEKQIWYSFFLSTDNQRNNDSHSPGS
jgi:hypothetical protein